MAFLIALSYLDISLGAIRSSDSVIPSTVRIAVAISGGVKPFGVRYLRTKGTLPIFDPK